MRTSRFRLFGAALLVLGIVAIAIFGVQLFGGSTQETDPAMSSESGNAGGHLPPLVFARHANIWRSRGDASPPQQLTQLEGSSFAINPVVSPDGKQIAYAVVEQPDANSPQPLPTSNLFVMNSDGSESRLVWDAPQGIINNISWTRDASSLYVGITGLRAAPAEIGGMQLAEIVIIDMATGAFRPFIADASDPVVSPDGQWVSYIAVSESADGQEAGPSSLQMTTLSAGEIRVVVDDPAFKAFYAPRFSPDGTRIIFAAVGGPDTASPSTTGSADTSLSSLVAHVLHAVTPAARAHGLPYDLWVVNIDGTNLQRITRINEDQPMTIFSPDGKYLVMMGAGGIYRLNADGSELQLLDNVGGHGGLDWLSR